MKEAAEETMERKIIISDNEVTNIREPKWITKEIKEGIKYRKYLNREKRKVIESQRQKELEELYQKQKVRVQQMIKEAMEIYEYNLTKEIKENKDNKKLWENIRKLKGENEKFKADQIFDKDGKIIKRKDMEETLFEYWEKIYTKHENEINDIWNQDSKDEYEKNYDKDARFIMYGENGTADLILEEHIDLAYRVNRTPKKMSYPIITDKEVQQYLKKVNNNKAAGPNGLKSDLYKTLGKDRKIVEKLTECLNRIIVESHIPGEWMTTTTNLIPKVKKPQTNQLKPIALSNFSYKMLMSILRDKIDKHIKENNWEMERQTGFTKGCRIEDNLLVLKYCINSSFKSKKSLIITAIDFSKAFDSVKRSKLIETLIKFHVHPQIIDIIAKLYTGDKTYLKLNEEIRKEIEITSGIKQGCTISTTLFKLVTYLIIKKWIKQD